MIATFFNWMDVKKYYLGTFILVPEVTEHVLYVNHVDSEYIYVRDYEGESGGIALTTNGYKIQDLLPRKQYYQYNSTNAAMIQRIPARMWKKGVHEENTRIMTVGLDGTMSPINVNHSNLETFQQQKNKFNQLSDVKSTFRSMALSPRLCVTGQRNLLLDSFCIGRLGTKKKIALVMKEFVNCLPPQQGPWEIKTV